MFLWNRSLEHQYFQLGDVYRVLLVGCNGAGGGASVRCVGSEMRSVSITSPLSASVSGCPLSQASRTRTITAPVTMRNNAADMLLCSDSPVILSLTYISVSCSTSPHGSTFTNALISVFLKSISMSVCFPAAARKAVARCLA